MVVEDSIEQLRGVKQPSCTCRRIALASAGSERVAVGNNWAGVLPVSCWRRSRPELTEQERICGVIISDDYSVYNGYLSMHSRNVWLILDATSKVLKLGHGNNQP